MDSLTILIMGKGGVGKSSTVNSVIGERVVAVSAFQVWFHTPFFFECWDVRMYTYIVLYRISLFSVHHMN